MTKRVLNSCQHRVLKYCGSGITMYYNGRKRYLRSSRKRLTSLVIVLTKSGRPLPNLPPLAGEGIRGSAGSSSKRRLQDHSETSISTRQRSVVFLSPPLRVRAGEG